VISREGQGRALRRRLRQLGASVDRRGNDHFVIRDATGNFLAVVGNTPKRGGITKLIRLVAQLERAEQGP
jgi:hypothetical protein